MQGRKIKDEEHSWKDEEVTLRDFTKGFITYVGILATLICAFSLISGDLSNLHFESQPRQITTTMASVSPDRYPAQYEYLGNGAIGAKYSWGWFNYSYGQFLVEAKIYSVSGVSGIHNPYVEYTLTRYFGSHTWSGGQVNGTSVYGINFTNGQPEVVRSFEQTFDSVGLSNNVIITVSISTYPSFSATVKKSLGSVTWKSVLNNLVWDFFGGN